MKKPLVFVLLVVAIVASIWLCDELLIQKETERFNMLHAPDSMAWLLISITRYYESNNAFPERLDQLVSDAAGTSWISDLATVDIWKNDYRLNSSGDGKSMLITSYGRDGQIGGSGADADMICELTLNKSGEESHSWLVRVVAANDPNSTMKTLREVCEALGTNWMKQNRVLSFEF